MVNPGESSAGQMAKTGSPHLVIMTAGGNNAGFYDIAMSCICQLDKDHDFGAVFPDDGGCSAAIQRSKDYIDNIISIDLANTIRDILNTPQAKSHIDFNLYVIGYVQFFNLDEDLI